MAENPKPLFLRLVFLVTKPHTDAVEGHTVSSCLSVTMTPDPQESQGFGTPVLGMGGWGWERRDIFFITPHEDKEEVLKTRREKQPVTYQGTSPPK